jgi:hypothetical protein
MLRSPPVFNKQYSYFAKALCAAEPRPGASGIVSGLPPLPHEFMGFVRAVCCPCAQGCLLKKMKCWLEVSEENNAYRNSRHS